MRILQCDDIFPAKRKPFSANQTLHRYTHLLNLTSATRSLPPLMLSARKTFPVEAMATMWECSLKGLNVIGS
jgi:hypothetical protein